jgi:DNA ligase-1
MELGRLVDLVTRVRETPGKKAKVSLIAEALRQSAPGEVPLVALYLTGRVRQGRIGVGWRTLSQATAEGPGSGEPLSLRDVDRSLETVANEAGAGSAGRRREVLEALLRRADPGGRELLTRLILGEMRQGALDGLVREAIARAAELPVADVRRAAMFADDLGALAHAALTRGAEGLSGFSMRLLSPVAPMLASPADDVGAALERLGEAAFEYKVDGARIQVHRSGEDVRVFTRQLQDVTARVPEVVAWARGLKVDQLVLEGEAVVLRPDGRPQPFQVTMRRLGRSKGVEALRRELPLSFFFFDCLFLEGEGALIDRPYRDRVARLAELVSEDHLLPRLVAGDRGKAEAFLAEAVAAGHEGVMAKSLPGPYVAGQRGFHWLKLKPVETLDLIVLAAEWGSGRRKGWLSNLHLGARDAEGGPPVMLGKTFKGLTDAMLRWQTEKLLALEEAREEWVVRVRPELVVEIAFSDVQASPRYPGGLALRFARVRAHRPDKPAGEADTIQAVREIFERQRA